MTQFGPYQLQVTLGRGGMGQVHRAYDTRRGRVVAVKVLLADLADDAAFRSRFARECQSVARLREPHVIPIHDFGEIDGRLYLDMRLVDGVDLGTVLTDGPLPLADAVDVIAQVASALDAAHHAGLVHRDVKPGNVLLSETGTDQRVGFAYLVDFGIARSDVRTSSGTSTAGLVGTVAYMAPERIAGDLDDARADVYSLACVLYECLAGRPPFEGDTYQVLYKQVNTMPPRLDTLPGGIPSSVADVLERGLAKDPAERYPTAGALAAAARVAVATGVAADPTGPTTPAPAPTPTPGSPALRERYRFVRDLGRGGMGTVWLARDEHLSRLVAVKRMLPDVASDPVSVKRIMREAEMAARLHHPNSVMVLDRIVEDGVPHVVMEYVRGRTLAAVITEREALDVATTAEIGLQIAAALAEAHRLGIAHRDVKPANVLVTADGVAKLADFGVARATDDPTATATAAGHMTGTIAYMAPEVASGGPGSPESDMWSLGATLYACTEGHAPLARPGQSQSATAMLLRLVNEPMPAPTRAGALTPLLLQLLDPEPSRRPSPARVRRELAELAGVHPLPVVDPDDSWPLPELDLEVADAPSPPTEVDLPRAGRGSEGSLETVHRPWAAATPVDVPPVDVPPVDVPPAAPPAPPPPPGSTSSGDGPADRPPARRHRARWWVAAAVAAVLAAGGVTAVGLWGGSGSPAATGGSSASSDSPARRCRVGTGPNAPRGCTLTDTERALGARIPTRFEMDTCETMTKAAASAITDPAASSDLIAGVRCSVANPASAAEYIDAVSFKSDAGLQAFLAQNLYSFDFASLPAGKCGVNGAQQVAEPWKAGTSSGTRYCDVNDGGSYAALAWTYASEHIVLVAVTTPNHITTTVNALVTLVWSGSLSLG